MSITVNRKNIENLIKGENQSSEKDTSARSKERLYKISQESAILRQQNEREMILNKARRRERYLAQKREEYERLQAEEQSRLDAMRADEAKAKLQEISAQKAAFKQENGGRVINNLSKLGAYLGGFTGASHAGLQEAKKKANQNLAALDEFDAQEEKYRKVYEEKFEDDEISKLDSETIALLDAINDGNNVENAELAENRNRNIEANKGNLSVNVPGGYTYSDSSYKIKAKNEAIKKLEEQGINDWEKLAEIRQRQKNKEDKEEAVLDAQEYTDEHPILSFVGKSLLSATEINTFPETLKSKLFDKYDLGIDENSPIYTPTNIQKTVDSRNMENHDAVVDVPIFGDVDLYDFGYNLASSAADNAIRAVTSLGNTGFMSTMMFGQVFSHGFLDAKEKGYSDNKAFGMAFTQAAIEGATEKWSLDAILKSPKTFFGGIARGFAAEGSEEIASNWANRVADAFVNGNNAEIKQAYNAYIRDGYSHNQALSAIIVDMVGEDLEAGLIGGLSGAGMSTAVHAPASIRQAIEDKAVGQSLRAQGKVGDLAQNILSESANSESAFSADKTLQNLAKRGENLSSRKAGKMARLADSASSESTLTIAVAEMLADTGMDEDAAVSAAPAVLKSIRGEKLSIEQRALLKDSEAVQSVISSLKDTKSAQAVLAKAEEENLFLKAKLYAKPSANTVSTADVQQAKAKIDGDTGVKSDKITSIVSSSEDGVWYRTNSGEVVRGTAVEFENDGVAQMFSDLADLDNINAANVALVGYSGQNVPMYTAAVQRVVRAASTGQSLHSLLAVNRQTVGVLGEQLTKAIYDAAGKTPVMVKNYTKADLDAVRKTGGVLKNYTQKLTAREDATVRVIDEIGKKYGVAVVVCDTIDGGQSNGFYNEAENMVYIGLDAHGGLYLSALGHELFHHLKAVNPESADELHDFVIDKLKNSEKYDYKTELKKRRKLYGADKSVRYLEEEMVADSMFSVFDSKTVETLVQEHRTLAEKIKDFLDDVLSWIEKTARNWSREAYALSEDEKTLSEIRDKFLSALDETAKSVAKGKSIGDTNATEKIKFSINNNFAKEYDSWDKRTPLLHFEIGRTSRALQGIGIEDKKIVWDSAKIIKIKSKHFEMTDEIIKQVPNILENPIIIMQSKTVNKRITLFGEVYANYNHPVLVALELYPSRNNIAIDEIKIASAYQKNNAQALINSSTILYVDRNKKRIDRWSKFTRLQLPVNNVSVNSNTTVPQNGTSVNTHSMQNSSEDAQDGEIRKSMKDFSKIESEYNDAVKNNDIETAQKIVDYIAKESGYDSPVLYHGTHSFGFTNFDLDKMDDKRSIFLTNNKNIASTYSGVTGTRNIVSATKNINNLSAYELVNELNNYDAQYKSDTTEGAHHYEFYDLQKTNKLIDTVNNGIEYLKNIVDELIKDYSGRTSTYLEEKDAKIYKKLVELSEKLKAYDYENLSTPIYLLLHHTDVFNGSKEIATLEKNIRLMSMLRNADTVQGIIVDEALDGYIIELMSIDEAKQHFVNRLKQGNYSLYAKLGKSLVIDGKGALWKDIRHWTSSIEIHPTSVSVVKKDGFYELVDSETKKIIPNASMAVNSYTDELYFSNKDTLRSLMVNKANEIIRIKTESINTTRGIAKFARERGYDSVVFKNIRDNGGMNSEVDYDEVADIYVIFDPASVKSADAITYDDDGNIIPLSDRFDSGDNDIRYSQKDSAGKQLSQQQIAYFKDSKVRDENGNLLVVYHGTPDSIDNDRYNAYVNEHFEEVEFDEKFIEKAKEYAGDFYVFNPRRSYAERIDGSGLFFASNKELANWYAKSGRKPKVYETYLNITNPFFIDANGSKWNEIKSTEIESANRFTYVDYVTSKQKSQTSFSTKQIAIYARENGYDGVIIKDVADGDPGNKSLFGDVYVAFNSNQIKLIDNLNPTGNEDVRFSLKSAVEEDDKLIAVHNLREDELLKALRIGGLPMPSIAIQNSAKPNNSYGEISVLFRKESVDPEQNAANKVYSGDRYTPTYPTRKPFKTAQAALSAMQKRQKPYYDNMDSLKAAMTEELKSVGEIKARADALSKSDAVPDRYFELEDLYFDLFERLSAYAPKQKTAEDTARKFLYLAAKNGADFEAIQQAKNKLGMESVPVSMEGEVLSLLHGIQELPISYFEAKPERVVDFSEVAAVVVPNTVSEELKNALYDKGFYVIEYIADDKTSRLKAVNSVDGVRFSKKTTVGFQHDTTGDDEYLLWRNQGTSAGKENIRKSLKNTVRTQKDLLEENRQLRKTVDLLKQEFKLTAGHKLNAAQMETLSKRILRQTHSSYDLKTLTENLTAVFEAVANGNAENPVAFDDTVRAMSDIAMAVLEESSIKNTEAYDTYKDMRDYFRTTPFSLSETAKQEIPDYDAFRKSNFGRMRIADRGISLDSLWGEISAQWPEFFPQDAHEAEQALLISEALEAVRPVYENPYAYDVEEAAYDLAMQMYDAYFDIQEKHTFADKADMRRKMELTKLRNGFDRRISQMRTESKAKYKADLAEVRKTYQDRIRAEKQAKWDKVKEVQQVNAYRRERDRRKRIEQDSKVNLRRRIIKNTKELNSLLVNPTDQKHIPQGLQGAVLEFCKVMTSDTSVFTKARIENLANAYKAIANVQDGEESDLLGSYDADIADMLTELQKAFDDNGGKKRLSELSVSELRVVDTVVQHLKHIVKNENKLFFAHRKATIDQMGNAAIRELNAKGVKKVLSALDIKGLESLKTLLVTQNLKPIYFFKKIGGVMQELYEELQRGEDDAQRSFEKQRAFFVKTAKENDYFTWAKDEKSFVTESGAEFTLTADQMLAIYATYNREQGRAHLLNGGICFKENSRKFKEKTKIGVSVKYTVKESRSIPLTEKDLANIIGALTEEQRAYADKMVQYLSKDVASLGNDISLSLYGYKKFNEPLYFPIVSNKNYLYTKQTTAQDDTRIKHASFTHKTIQNADNPIVISGFTDVWARHCTDMATYHAFALRLEDFNRVWNYKVRTDETDLSPRDSVKSSIENAFGSEANKYIHTLLIDVNGGATVQTDGTDTMIAKFKRSAVFMSLSVAIQQPSAIARAFAMVDPKYFVQIPQKGTYEEAKKYSAVAALKERGYFDTGMAQSTAQQLVAKEYDGVFQTARNGTLSDAVDALKEKGKGVLTDTKYRDDLMGWLPGKMDEWTWSQIWLAVKAETQAKYGLQGVELLKKTGERFDEVVRYTQVYDSVFSRSGNMRNKGSLYKMATAFMSEPTTSLNMVMDAFSQGRTGNRKYAARAMAALVSSYILNAALVSFVYAGRDDDEDETFLEKYLISFMDNLTQNLNPLNAIPFVRDFWNLVQGYSVERADMSIFKDLVDAFKTMLDDKKSFEEKISVLAGSVGNFFGIPIRNVMRDFSIIGNVKNTLQNGRETTLGGVWNGFLEEHSNGLYGKIKERVGLATENEYEQLYDAIMNGDSKLRQTLWNNLNASGKSDKDIQSGLRSVLKKDTRITEAAQARLNGDSEKYAEIVEEFKKRGFAQNTIVGAVNSAETEIKKESGISSEQEGDDSEPEYRVSVYAVSDAVANLDVGDTREAQTIVSDIYDSKKEKYVSEGKSNDEAAKSARSSVKSALTKEYKTRYINGTATERKQIEQSLTEITVDGKPLYDAEDIRDWLN